MRKILAVIWVVLVLSAHTFAQNIGVAINADGSAPNSSTILDVSSTTKGFAPPRMTHVQKLAIASPATGLIVWCTNCGFSGELQIFNGTTWVNTIGGVAAGVSPGAPTIGTATAGNAQATVTFTAPVSNGGSAITSYTATSSPGGLTGTLNQAGSGTITVTGLTNGTAYTFTVTATTVSGTSSSSAASNSVTPMVPPITDGSGNTYESVTIGTQTWMTKNLNTTKYNDGVDIPNITLPHGYWSTATTGAWCNYNNTASNATTYGKLYNWYVADNNAATKLTSNGGRNVCPIGWHVPSDTEWTTLITYLGGETVAGGKLKESDTSHWITPNTGATNSSGFTALPGGFRADNGGSAYIGQYGMWWSSTATYYTNGGYTYMISNSNAASSYSATMQQGYSVRCLKD